MERSEFIMEGGKEELAKAISYCVVRAMTDKLDISCNELIGLVESTHHSYLEWLEQEISED